MEILIKASQFVLSLSILIVAHEMGHFLFAKLFKTRVEKFYLFFDPWFSLFKIKKGETEYGIGWLPLGGYVKISGMIDESMDKEQMAQPPQPWEFRSKPTWQRLLIMIGGVTVNFVLALVIYSLICFVWGRDEVPVSHAKYGMIFCKAALDNGFQNGDKIIAADGLQYENIGELNNKIVLEQAREVTIERDGQQMTLQMPDNLRAQYLEKSKKTAFSTFNFPFIVDSVLTKTPAEKVGVKKGDLIVSINDTITENYVDVLTRIPKYADKEMPLAVVRGSDTLHFSVLVAENGKIGIAPKSAFALLGGNHISYTFWQSIPAGIQLGVKTLSNYVSNLGLIFTKEGAREVGGFIAIGNIFPPTWDWHDFWMLTAFLSIILAFMNILPIPALDGGHVMFLLYEMITGRKPSDKFLEYAQITGMVILLGLLLYANGNDIIKLFE